MNDTDEMSKGEALVDFIHLSDHGMIRLIEHMEKYFEGSCGFRQRDFGRV